MPKQTNHSRFEIRMPKQLADALQAMADSKEVSRNELMVDWLNRAPRFYESTVAYEDAQLQAMAEQLDAEQDRQERIVEQHIRSEIYENDYDMIADKIDDLAKKIEHLSKKIDK